MKVLGEKHRSDTWASVVGVVSSDENGGKMADDGEFFLPERNPDGEGFGTGIILDSFEKTMGHHDDGTFVDDGERGGRSGIIVGIDKCIGIASE